MSRDIIKKMADVWEVLGLLRTKLKFFCVPLQELQRLYDCPIIIAGDDRIFRG